MKAELRETWYNMCVDCGVQENRWSGENFSDCCNVAPTEERALVAASSESKKGAWRGLIPMRQNIFKRGMSQPVTFSSIGRVTVALLCPLQLLLGEQKGHRISLLFSS